MMADFLCHICHGGQSTRSCIAMHILGFYTKKYVPRLCSFTEASPPVRYVISTSNMSGRKVMGESEETRVKMGLLRCEVNL